MSSTVSGMAASIRAATESETFDLAGNSTSTITTTIKAAFATPITLSSMIRITFITGAGKLGRQKYDESAAKVLTSALRELGYEDDRGASCVNECAGSFKLQHDTGKNLKTVVVFPFITGEDTIQDGVDLDGSSAPSLLDPGTPPEMIAMSSMNTFERMVGNKCASWNQKKECLNVVTLLKTLVEELDQKLAVGTVLTDSEQNFYDSISIESLNQKATFVKEAMKKHVDEGAITKSEKDKLISQVKDKLNALNEEIDDATKGKKVKKVNKLNIQKEKLTERFNTLDNITQKAPRPLKHQSDIEKLRKEMQPLLKLEKETKGRLLSIKETTLLGRKEEIEEEIYILEDKSRGWFEDDDEFQLRVDASRSQAKLKAASASKKKATGSGGGKKVGSTKKAITNWVVPGAKKVTRKPAAKKTTTSNAFAAMMMDSDSDSD